MRRLVEAARFQARDEEAAWAAGDRLVAVG
jgi:hypothetical protein